MRGFPDNSRAVRSARNGSAPCIEWRRLAWNPEITSPSQKSTNAVAAHRHGHRSQVPLGSQALDGPGRLGKPASLAERLAHLPEASVVAVIGVLGVKADGVFLQQLLREVA